MPQVDESAWIPDTETPGQIAMLVEDKNLMAGLWRSGGVAWEPFDVPMDYDETLYVLSGSARLQLDDGPVMDLTPGDVIFVPKGAVAHWEPSIDFTELWMYY